MTYPKKVDDCTEHIFSTNGSIHCRYGNYDGKRRCEICGISEEGLNEIKDFAAGVEEQEVVGDNIVDGNLIVQYTSCGMRFYNGKKHTKFRRLTRHEDLNLHFSCSYKSDCPIGMLCELKFEVEDLTSAYIKPLGEFYDSPDDINHWKVEERVAMQEVHEHAAINKMTRQNKDISNLTLAQIKDTIRYKTQSKSHMIAYIAGYLSE